jgi:hypothetical protein
MRGAVKRIGVDIGVKTVKGYVSATECAAVRPGHGCPVESWAERLIEEIRFHRDTLPS